MKQVIELLKEAKDNIFKAFLAKENHLDFLSEAVNCIIDVLKELQNPTPITPDQFREQEGREYPDDGAVYFEYGNKWHVDFYRNVKAERILKIDYIVCAYNLTESPPAGWRPK
jgi:hypothetical protein